MARGGRWDRLRRGARNALTLWRDGRLGAPYHAPYEVVWEEPRVRLRRYSSQAVEAQRAILLVPPLMVTSEIYDISPELSAVAWLAGQGADVWVADFGAPEELPGGVERTLDDHVLAVSACIDRIRERTGHDVHLVGYSQGGMFCYQTAAYRKGAGLASVIAFGAPVDMYRNAPLALHESIVDQAIGLVRRVIDKPLDDLRALPGTLSSLAFKLVAPGQELRHLIQLLGILPDRERYLLVEPKRKFLGGEGFIAWPGPALRKFIDDFVVANRMKQGGFVIAGRTIALADLVDLPILTFIGDADDLAHPEAVRGIVSAAPLAKVSLVHVPAGHFGLVVGSVALKTSWPTVLAWTRWIDGRGERPTILDAADLAPTEPSVLERGWSWLGKLGARLGDAVDAARQVPRVVQALRLRDDHAVSFGKLLDAQARRIADDVFFVWEGRAYTFAEADRRVSEVAAHLYSRGVRAGQRVAVRLGHHPDRLAVGGALSRLGAVAVLDDSAHEREIADVGSHPGDVLDVDVDHGRASELAYVAGEAVTNGAWLRAALAAAIAARLAPRDTVYCALRLDDRLALEAAVGGALVSGARLALAIEPMSGEAFWREVRNVGASVVVADEALVRSLLAAPQSEADRLHPIRFVLVHALDAALSEALVERFGGGPAGLEVIVLGRKPAPDENDSSHQASDAGPAV